MDRPKIQWYPGHIAKAEKKLSEMINKVDLVIEVRDARIPISTGHPHLNKWIINKKHILVINRSDMISANTITSWNKWFNEKDQYPHWCDAKRGIGINEICKSAKESRASIDARRISRGMRIRPYSHTSRNSSSINRCPRFFCRFTNFVNSYTSFSITPMRILIFFIKPFIPTSYCVSRDHV